MADNIKSITDPTVYIKPSKKLVDYLNKNFNGPSQILDKRKVSGKVEALMKKSSNKLDNSDLEWLNELLIGQRNISDGDLFTGKELDDAIEELMRDNFSKMDAVGLLKEKNKGLPYLHELMAGSELLLPENELVERNPVLAERIERLKKAQEEREYQAMTQNVETSIKRHHQEDSISYQMNMMNRHLIAVGQLLVSIGAGFAFGFLGIELMIGDIHFGVRLLLGISIALIIGLAEFYFLAKSLNEEEKRSGGIRVTKVNKKNAESVTNVTKPSKNHPKGGRSKPHRD